MWWRYGVLERRQAGLAAIFSIIIWGNFDVFWLLFADLDKLLLFFLLLFFIIFNISSLTLSRFFFLLILFMYGSRILLLLAVLPLLRPFILPRLRKCELSAHNHLHFELTARVLLALPYVPLTPVKERVHCHSKKKIITRVFILLESLIHNLWDKAREEGRGFGLETGVSVYFDK